MCYLLLPVDSNPVPRPALAYHALVLAGGQSRRLGGTPKAGLSNGSTSLLANTLDAVAGAQCRLVVGPAHLPVPAGVLQTQEDPPFGGPALAIAAGLSALPVQPAPWIMILSVDMPAIAAGVAELLACAQSAPSTVKGFMGVCDGYQQPLAGIYRSDALLAAFEGTPADASVRSRLDSLHPQQAQLPTGSTDDVDTWEAARRLGFTEPLWKE